MSLIDKKFNASYDDIVFNGNCFLFPFDLGFGLVCLSFALTFYVNRPNVCLLYTSEYLASKKIIKLNLPKYLDYTANISKSTKYNPANQNQKIKEWVDPVREIMFKLQSKSFQKVEYFDKYKEKLLRKDGQLAHFDKMSKEMYAKRLKLFKKMTEEALPYVTLFIEKRDLQSVLAKYGF